MSAVEVRDLTRDYRHRKGLLPGRTSVVKALRGVSFDIAPGRSFALLGPNGAGTTTTTKLLTPLLLPTSRSVRVLGLDPATPHTPPRRRRGDVIGRGQGPYH